MRNRSKIVSIILMMTLALIAGCGDKEETKSDTNVTKQEEVSQIIQGAEEEVSKTAPVVNEEIIVDEASKVEDIDYLAIHGITLDRIYSWIMEGTEGIHIADGEQIIVDAIEKWGSKFILHHLLIMNREAN